MLLAAAMLFFAPPCPLIAGWMRDATGERAVACSDVRCANDAFRRKVPFTQCNSGFGLDSNLESGVAGVANGNLLIYQLDTRGPATRGTCLRPNVSLAADDWPRCKTALIDEIDLRTGKPYEGPPKSSVEEEWPPACAQRVLHAASQPFPKLIRGENPLPHPEQWGMTCRRGTVSFQMLVGRSGNVECARIISVGFHPADRKLYDDVRSRLMQWRFAPPTLHGEPVDVRFGMTINSVRKGERPLPGPQIYPVCP
jgi:hypothetical protein